MAHRLARFGITQVAHPFNYDQPERSDCMGCLELAEKAAIQARAHGTKAWAHSDGLHAATVVRLYGLVELA